MFGVVLRRGASVKHPLFTSKTVSLVITDNPARLFSRNDNDGKKCCKELDQTTLGADCKEIKDPNTEKSYPNFQCNAPMSPHPPNYDPYRIKVPDYAVPPLPPSGAKPMMQYASMKSHCCPPPPCCPPPCPPPKKRFPWFWILLPLALLGIAGLMWKSMCSKKREGHRQQHWSPRRKRRKPQNPGDLPICVQYLIIGAGAAGWAAYRAIMENDKTAKVFIISQEDVYPYVRPPMSKYMWLNKEPPDLKTLNYIADNRLYSMYLAECSDFMDPVKFYNKKTGPAVSIATGYCVIKLDADDHIAYISTACGEQPIYYERCLLAPGAKPKNLQFFKTASKNIRQRVCLLRDLRDLEMAYRKVQEAKHVTVIGGGCLGSELAYYLGKRNKMMDHDEDDPPMKITHIIKDKGIMGNTLPAYLGKWAREVIKCQGVDVIHSTQVYDAHINVNEKLELTLSNGNSLETDYVFVAVGADPRVNLAEVSMLELDDVNGGYLVNTEQEARKHLYVAGDAASVYFPWKDERMRLEHYSNAEDEGYIAGANMTGYWIANNLEPHFRVRFLEDLEFEVVGETGACMPTIALFKPCAEEEEPVELEATSKPNDQNGDGDSLKCFERGKEYRNLYKRGILFYLREETVVGIIYWNYRAIIPSSEDRKGVATEILRAKPSYKEINVLAELLGFKNAKCVYLTSAEKQLEEDEECLTIPYKDYSASLCPPPPCPLKPCDEIKPFECD